MTNNILHYMTSDQRDMRRIFQALWMPGDTMAGFIIEWRAMEEKDRRELLDMIQAHEDVLIRRAMGTLNG